MRRSSLDLSVAQFPVTPANYAHDPPCEPRKRWRRIDLLPKTSVLPEYGGSPMLIGAGAVPLPCRLLDTPDIQGIILTADRRGCRPSPPGGLVVRAAMPGFLRCPAPGQRMPLARLPSADAERKHRGGTRRVAATRYPVMRDKGQRFPRRTAERHSCSAVPVALRRRDLSSRGAQSSLAVLQPGFETLGWAYSGGQL